MFIFLRRSILAIFVSGFIFSSSSSLASGKATYHVTITNITNAIVFTPILVASHRKPISLFELGSPASEDLSTVAESGDTGPMMATLDNDPEIVDVQSSGAALAPGESVTVIVRAGHGAKRISVVSMLLPTNDGFFALDSVRVPRHRSATYFSPGYDSGSEFNDESCANSIPGPPGLCGGEGVSAEADTDEGYVHIHRGMHGIADLEASTYDWRNPVAKITVVRVRNH